MTYRRYLLEPENNDRMPPQQPEQQPTQYVDDDSSSKLSYKLEDDESSWTVLVVYCFANFLNGILLLGYDPIAHVASTFFDVSPLYIHLTTYSSLVAGIAMLIPASFVQFMFGMRPSLVFGSLLSAISSPLLYVTEQAGAIWCFTFSRLLQGIAFAFIFPLAPRLAAVHFARHRQALATSIGVCSCVVGIGVGWLVQRSLIHNYGNKIAHQLQNCSIFYSCVSFFILMLVYFFFPTRALKKRRSSTGTYKTHYRLAFNLVFESKSFHLLAQSYAIYFSLYLSCRSVLYYTLTSTIHISGFEYGIVWANFIHSTAVVPGALILAMMLDQSYRRMRLAIILNTLSCASSLVFCVLYVWLPDKAAPEAEFRFLALFVVFCLGGLVSTPYICFGMAQGALMSPPSTEVIAGALLTLLACVYSVLFGAAFKLLVLYSQIQVVLTLLVTLYILSSTLSVAAYLNIKKLLL